MDNVIPFSRVEKSPEKCEANRTRGYAKLMSDAGQHGLAERLMDEAREVIRDTIIATMPTTAAANGLIGPIPTRADAAAILDGPQGAAVARFVGLSGLMRSLSSLGLPCDKATARAVREEIIRRDLVEGSPCG